MKIAFYKGKGQILDKVIKWFTGGNFSHVEILFKDGICFSSSTRDKGIGCRFKQIDMDDGKWGIIDVEVPDESEEAVRDWCTTQLACKYDFIGIIGFAITPFRNSMQSDKRWYCSEIVAEGLRRGNTKYDNIPKRINPSMLHAWLGGFGSWSDS